MMREKMVIDCKSAGRSPPLFLPVASLCFLVIVVTLLTTTTCVPSVRSEPVSLFEQLKLTIVRAHTTRNKPPSGHRRSPRAPDLYINVWSIQKASDGTDTGKDMYLGKTKVIKNSHRPVFNETFTYERDHQMPYTIGTDGVLRIHLYDQAPALIGTDEDLGYFDVPLGNIVEDEKSGIEMMGQIGEGSAKSSIAYRVDYKIDPMGTRQEGAGVDDDFSFGNEPVSAKKTSGRQKININI